MTVYLVTSQLGYFEFRLCSDKATAEQIVTQECFDRHLLKMVDGSTRYYPVNQNNQFQTVSVLLPTGDVSCDQCVIQWRHVTGLYLVH